MSDLVVVEVSRRGRVVMGEPFFTPGVPLPIDKKGLADVGEGELVVVSRGRGRARFQRALGPADRIETVLEGLLEHEGLRRGFEPFELPEPSLHHVGRHAGREHQRRDGVAHAVEFDPLHLRCLDQTLELPLSDVVHLQRLAERV